MATTNPTNTEHTSINKFNKEKIDLTRLKNGVIYGTQALGISTEQSDLDIAFSYESDKELYEILKKSGLHNPSTIGYFQISPEHGYHSFFRKQDETPYIDILFVHTDEDLDVIRSSVKDLQKIPTYILENKSIRCKAYQQALLHRGWKESSTLHNNDDTANHYTYELM